MGVSNMTYFWIILISIIIATVFYYIGSAIPEEYIKYLDNAGIVLGYLISVLTVGAVVVAVVKKEQIKQWFKKPEFKGTGEKFRVPSEKVVAMIIPVSRREQPEWLLRHLRPNYVGLIYTEMSKNTALQLTEEFQQYCKFIPSKDEILQSKNIINKS